MKRGMDFETYWNQYGELHASMCNVNIKQFAKDFWLSAQDKPEKRKPLADGTLPLTDEELEEFKKIIKTLLKELRIKYDTNLECIIYEGKDKFGGTVVEFLSSIKAIAYLLERFKLIKED